MMRYVFFKYTGREDDVMVISTLYNDQRIGNLVFYL